MNKLKLILDIASIVLSVVTIVFLLTAWKMKPAKNVESEE